MKILHCVESYFPSKGGMQEVVKQLSERLSALGHEVTVATRFLPERESKVLNGVTIRDFKISGNLVNGIQGETENYRRFLLESDADVIVFFAAQQWATDLALDLLPQIKSKKVSVPTGYSGFYNPVFREYFENMKGWIRNYDMNVYLSHHYRDIDFAKQNGVKAITVIPNGAAADEFLPTPATDVRKKLNLAPDTFIVLHVGSYTGKKGHREAVQVFLRARLKNAALLMIGNDHDKFWRQYVRHPLFGLQNALQRPFSGPVFFGDFDRSFTVAAYKQSNVFLFPSNIECSPIVLFECGAAGLPFLSSDAGNAPEIVEWTGGGQILPSVKDELGMSHVRIRESATMLRNMYENEKLRKDLARQGFDAWQKKFSWEQITLDYEKLYQSLLA